ncbi:Membrane protein involved in the export of O-antigen and teichoic acid [Paenibacillus sp. UNCCL117]|uniref:oligosaccharide flippase family protein n=1 Tax=unclassified Paenibacillus TaxID=185978 RepID=UPI00088604AC|nr:MULTISPECIES: oligosaccharide flippase family protein [unclassified Paenibacillus]SDC02872.1 Membrane protein involved in the export of O-antigen and teichoic acid [Paenibacillus sp. cl123]SFW36945.1 Membrane protein involved in the export of O-antigen and teichoic acid [Paenibacillus sp. UNCCL117]
MKRLFLSSLSINVLVILINLITGIISARYLGPEGRGELATATRWSMLLTMLFTLGLPGAVIFLGKKNPDRQREFFGVYLVLGVSMGLIALVVGETLMPVLLQGHAEHVVLFAQISMLAVPFGLLADGLIGTLQTLNMFRRVLLLRILNPVGVLLVITGLLLMDMYTVKNFIIGSLVWSFLLFLMTFTWVYTSVRPKVTRVLQTGRELFNKGVQIYSVGLVSAFGGNLDQLIISLFLTTYMLGLYTVSSSIASMLPSIITGALGTFLFPKLMDLALDRRQKQVERMHGTLFYGTLLLAAAAACVIPFAIPFVYGADFKESVLMGQVLLICTPINIAYAVLTNYVSTEGKFHYVSLSEVLGLASGVGMTLLLVQPLQGVGAALGVVTMALVKWSFIVYRCTKMGLSLRSLLYVYPESFRAMFRTLLEGSRRIGRKSASRQMHVAGETEGKV